MFYSNTVSHKLFIRIIALALSVFLLAGSFPIAMAETLTDQQLNAIAMLNYISVLSQDIMTSKGNRMYLEEAYSSLINNLYPNSVDSDSLSQLNQMLDIMESCRMLTIKRDRIQFLYEQEQAGAIYSIFPDPLDFLSTVQESSGKGKIALLAYIAINSVANYAQAVGEAEEHFIEEGWELDDEEAQLIHEGRKSIFNYMVTMVNSYDIPGYLTLTEKTVQDYVEWKNNENNLSRLHFFESNAETYKAFGGYWLTLAECYYENGDYKKCLEAINEYQDLNIRIFRKDYDLARKIPLAIVSAYEINGKEYPVEETEAYIQLILDNTDYDNWALRMFGAQTYLDLYSFTKEKQYLEKAYQIAFDNVNYLINEQRSINKTYLAPVQESETPKEASNSEKEQIKQYNQMLKEKRKTELPEIYEPLRLNVDMLFQTAKEIGINESEALKIDGILHPKGESLFLNQPVDQKYWATTEMPTQIDPELIEFAGTAIRIPVAYVSADAQITVSVKEENEESETMLTDWVLSEVKRDSDTNLDDMYAIYLSEDAKKHQWGPNSTIIVKVLPKTECEVNEIISNYTSEEVKKDPLDWLKVWEGHKNEWYDYLKVWENTVNFVYVP